MTRVCRLAGQQGKGQDDAADVSTAAIVRMQA